MSTFLIEIGTEEIPAGYIIPALNAFRDSLAAALERERISCGCISTYGTPRRLALIIDQMADEQSERTSTITGPPAKVGFDDAGRPTIAAEKFAEKAGISIDEIKIADTEKGRYLTAVVKEECLTSRAVLENILEKQILSIPFPKSMRWGALSISFARPIISLAGIIGNQVLDFSVGNIKCSGQIRGHQFMFPKSFDIDSPESYLKTAESAGVIPDIEKRKSMLVKAIQQCADQNNAKLLDDPELVDIVTNLVEYPYPVVGRFDDQFLEVPDEVLITAMREHQKYFALTDEAGNLKPLFIAVNNTKANNMDVVARGHEKVLRARLSDAKFFYEQDMKSTLDQFAEKLRKVTFQEQLGSVHDKTVRIGRISEYLAECSGSENKEILQISLKRAAQICKADLVSQVVIEFTKLQGAIGRVYAQKTGEAPDVAAAVEQHYWPVQSGGRLPENQVASLLSIADKTDTICGCFSLGLIPTGGTDPYALRRQGIGVVRIMMEENLSFSLQSLIDKALENFIDQDEKLKEVSFSIREFLKNRMINMFTDMGFSKEAVNSALSASFDHIPDAVLRIKAVDALRSEPDFEPLSITFKRVENIIKKAENREDSKIDTSLFESSCETELYAAVNEVKQTVNGFILDGNYEKALKTVSELRPKVDTFFDDVMVMADDDKIRQNRLALLGLISDLFKNIADFSKL